MKKLRERKINIHWRIKNSWQVCVSGSMYKGPNYNVLYKLLLLHAYKSLFYFGLCILHTILQNTIFYCLLKLQTLSASQKKQTLSNFDVLKFLSQLFKR